MKKKFLDFVPTFLKPWKDGSSGTPWSFTTGKLTEFGNSNLPPDTMVNKEGELVPVYLTYAEAEEVMYELGFNKNCFLDSVFGLNMVWEVELLPTMIF